MLLTSYVVHYHFKIEIWASSTEIKGQTARLPFARTEHASSLWLAGNRSASLVAFCSPETIEKVLEISAKSPGPDQPRSK